MATTIKVFGGTPHPLATYIFINESVAASAKGSGRVYGDINGWFFQWLRRNSHRYLGKKIADGEVAITQLDDSNSNKYVDGTAATLTGGTAGRIDGDVFVHIPIFFTEATEIDTSNHIWRIGFSGQKLGENWQLWDLGLIGAYEATCSDTTNNTSGVLYSRSGKASTGSVSQSNFKAKAANLGTGFSIVKWKHQCALAFLYYGMYGTTNCQGVCGSGTSSYEKSTGGTNSLGMTDTTTSNGNSMSINFLGLENWWGNKWEWLHNVTVDANVWKITEDDGTVRSVTGQSTYNTWVYPLNFVVGKHLDVIPRPTQTATSETQGYCDGIYMSGAGGRVVVRSCSNSIAQGGVACSGAWIDASASGADLGSRLAFNGKIVKVDRASYAQLQAVA